MVGHTQASSSNRPKTPDKKRIATAPAYLDPTPRKSRDSAADLPVPDVRQRIVNAMDGEFVVCGIVDWLKHYLPSFNDDEDINDIRGKLIKQKILEPYPTAARADASQQAIGEGSAEGNAQGSAGSRKAEDQGNKEESQNSNEVEGHDDGESIVSISDPEDKDYQEGRDTKEKGKQPDRPRRSPRLDPEAKEVPENNRAVDDGSRGPYRWVKYPRQPSRIGATENRAFAPLGRIVQAISTYSGRNNDNGRKVLKVVICPNTTLESDIPGSTNKIDGCLMFGASPEQHEKKIHTSDIVLTMEFKLNIQEQAQNRAQCLSAANQIMNDDPRRMFTFGMTIEDDKMSLWYFSRSHSAMSRSFSFVNDPDRFIRIILAFFRSSDEQLGFDPLVKRCVPPLPPSPTAPQVEDNSKSRRDLKRKSRSLESGDSEMTVQGSAAAVEQSAQLENATNSPSNAAEAADTDQQPEPYYIYTLPTGDSREPHYYKTVRCIDEYRALCITGRMTRIWEVIRVRSPDDETEIGQSVVLKDVWLDESADTEDEIQRAVFKDLDSFFTSSERPWREDSRLKEFTQEMVDHLEELSQGGYKNYFLTIEDHHVGKTSKDTAPNSVHQRGLFAGTDNLSFASRSRSVRTTSRAPDVPHDRPPSGQQQRQQQQKRRVPRRYLPKKQYRVVFKELCKALYHLPTLGEVVDTVQDVVVALELMFCAGWVHRDISTGNILAHKENGKWKAKLADLEYARRYPPDHTSAGDPKTGTPFFIPYEVALGYLLYSTPRASNQPPSVKTVKPGLIRAGLQRKKEQAQTKQEEAKPLRRAPAFYNFQHDLESVWWIIIWMVTDHACDATTQAEAFVAETFPPDIHDHKARMLALQNPIDEEILPCLPPAIADTFAFVIETLRDSLDGQYYSRETAGNLTDPASYSFIHAYFYSVLHDLQALADDGSSQWRSTRLKVKTKDSEPSVRDSAKPARAKRLPSQSPVVNVEDRESKRVKRS